MQKAGLRTVHRLLRPPSHQRCYARRRPGTL